MLLLYKGRIYFETPRIRVPLDILFFQRYIINQEGSDKLKNQANFNNYFNGIIVKADNFSDNLFMSLDISNARIVLEYDYNFYNTNGSDDISDDIIERKKKVNNIPLGGVTYNLFDHVGFNKSINDEVKAANENIPSEKIYLNGTKFVSKLKLFSELLKNRRVFWYSWLFYLARILISLLFVLLIPIVSLLTVENFFLRILIASVSAAPAYSYVKMASFKFFLEVYRPYPEVVSEYQSYYSRHFG